jgi:hypothetical protein
VIGRGRSSADAIAHGQIALAAGAARDAAARADCGAGQEARFTSLAEACGHLSGGGAALPRGLGLPGIVALREAAANLREECCAAAAATEPGPLYRDAIRLHQAMDAAATALGAPPDCFRDPDDWRLDRDDAPVPMAHLASTARTAVLVCHGLDSLLAGAGAPAGLMRRDAGVLVAGCLVLRSACLEPSGIDPGIARTVAEGTHAAAARLAASAAAWRAADPAGRVGRLADAIEAAGRLAADVLDDLRAPAPDAPGGP